MSNLPDDPTQFFNTLRTGDRQTLSRAITLIESRAVKDRQAAMDLLDACATIDLGVTFRIGITGVPGVGKSTLINALGGMITSEGHQLAVLTVDPSSERSFGSILGDKTRMEDLAADPLAFIRPSPTGGTLGGVARRTREAINLCEAAGFDRSIVETVGVGQSESLVERMTDMTVLLVLAGAGDELQGIKKGIMESADLIVVNKMDGDNRKAGDKAKRELLNAVSLLPARPHGERAPVITCSGLNGEGMDELYQHITSFLSKRKQSGYIVKHRAVQAEYWLKHIAQDLLLETFTQDSKVQQFFSEKNGSGGPYAQAQEAVKRFRTNASPLS